jgi:predicted dehydrogenase
VVDPNILHILPRGLNAINAYFAYLARMTQIRMAFIGAGNISNAHKEAFKLHPERLACAAVADPNQEAAAKLAAEFGAKVPVFTDYRKMLDTLHNGIDGAVITTPHFLHAPMAAEVLARGLPVLVEKPVTCTLQELRELQSLEKPGAFIQAGQMQRFGHEENWIKHWLSSPAFGEPRLFNLDIYQNIEGYTGGRENFWILDKRRAGGGIVISVAVHILDLLRYWFEDDYTEIYAKGRFDPPLINGAESTVAATITTRRGMIGTLNCSYTAQRCPYSQRTLVFGTNGTLYQHMDQPGGGYAGPYFTASSGGQPSFKWSMMYSGWQSVAKQMENDLLTTSQPPPTAFTNQMLAFADNIAAGHPGENSLARNLNTIAVIDAIGQSLLSGQPITVESL